MNSAIALSKRFKTKKNVRRICILLSLASAPAIGLRAQTTNTVPIIKIHADKVAARVSPQLYGLMTEEINYSYDGGLYAEQIRNRTFKWNPANAVYWQLVQEGSAAGAMSLDTNQPLNSALTTSLKLEVTRASGKQRAGIANDGFWGIPVRPNTRYRASFYAKAKGFSGPLNVEIMSSNGATVFASAKLRRVSAKWQKYEVTLTTGNVE